MFELQASQWIYFDKSLPIGYECIKNSQKTTILVKSRRVISKQKTRSAVVLRRNARPILRIPNLLWILCIYKWNMKLSNFQLIRAIFFGLFARVFHMDTYYAVRQIINISLNNCPRQKTNQLQIHWIPQISSERNQCFGYNWFVPHLRVSYFKFSIQSLWLSICFFWSTLFKSVWMMIIRNNVEKCTCWLGDLCLICIAIK